MQHRNVSRRLKIALVAAVAVLWSLVAADTFIRVPLPVKLPPLSGVAQPPAAPEWDFAALRSGATAKAVSVWFDAHVGLHSFWVRLDNQISYSLFSQIEKRNGGTQLVVSPDDWFYEQQYIEYSTCPSSLSEQELRTRIERMRRVQDKLAKRGIPILVIVGPNKAEIYPEHIPASYFAQHTPAATTTGFELARPQLQAAGIDFIDGPELFALWKREGMQDLFARSGTHWSYNSARLIWAEIRARLNPRIARPIPEFPIGRVRQSRPLGNDRDLLELANLLVPSVAEHSIPKPVFQPQREIAPENLPRLLWVHDSFAWVLLEELYESQAAFPTETFYYFNTRIKVPGVLPSSAKVEGIDWPSFLRDYDAIVVVWTEIAFEHDSWGFFETLDRALD